MKNDYCVYGHYLTSDDTLFYVGKGRRGREKSISRSKAWKEFTSDKDWYVKIFKSNLTNQEAIELETEYVELYKQQLVNVTVPRKDRLTLVEIASNFEINEESITGIVWKNSNGARNPNMHRKAGDVAGTAKYSKSGKPLSCEVGCKGFRYSTHRVVWFLMYNEDPGEYVIDHIDGNPLNNRASNLRKINFEGNSRNRSKQSNNTSGVSGVYLFNNGYGQTYYTAKITKDDKSQVKYFPIAKYGKDEALRLAIAWRQQKLQELNQQGAGYTDRHGT